ncbi:MAG: NINE protein [Bacteroidaceae bacterium]|nr:NINE protein [Bacteroidaceae bacterium]
MVTYTCPRCGGQISSYQPMAIVQCPHCGLQFQPAPSYGPHVNTGPTPEAGPQDYNQGYSQPQYAYQPAGPGVFDDGPSGKSRGVAGLLAILLGGFGAHYFYLGKIGGAFLCILLTIITCGLWSVLTLIQGILFFTMSVEDFERKYVHTNSSFPLF